MLHSACCWASAAEGGRAWEAPGLVCTAAAAPMRSFNQLFVTGKEANEQILRDAVQQYSHAGVPCRLRFMAAFEEWAAPVVEASGLVRQGGIPSMVLSGELPGDTGTDLDIRPVTDARGLADAVSVIAGAFDDWDAPDLDRVFTPRLLDMPEWRGWAGYARGEPVAASMLVVHGGVAGVYYVGVAGSHRRKGYGEAVTRAAIEEGFALGCDMAALQASPFGRPIYERLGFVTVEEYITYVPGRSERSFVV